MGAGTEDAIGLEPARRGGTTGSGTSLGPNCIYIYIYIYTYVSACARMLAHAVDREQYSQTNAHANANKRTVAFDAWAISACKRVCVLRVRSKTFRMYYSLTWCLEYIYYDLRMLRSLASMAYSHATGCNVLYS